MLFFLRSAYAPGAARQPLTFFASPKKVSKERRPPAAALRVPVYAAQKMGNGRNSLRSDNAHFSFHFLHGTNGSVSSGHCWSGSPLALPDWSLETQSFAVPFTALLADNQPRTSALSDPAPDAEGEEACSYPLGTLPVLRCRKWIKK